MRFEYLYVLKESISSIAIIIISIFICLKHSQRNIHNTYVISFILSITSVLIMFYPIYNKNNIHLDLSDIPLVLGAFLFGPKVGFLSTTFPVIAIYLIDGYYDLASILFEIYVNVFLVIFYKKYIHFNELDQFKNLKYKDILSISLLIIVSQNLSSIFIKPINITLFNIYHGFICFLCSIILKNIIKNEILSLNYKKDLEKKSFEDELTNIKNYRYLKENVHNFIQENQQFSLIFIDVDFFKNFNDKNGHLLGDYALMKLSKILMNEVRNDDIVARYGGEEFAILLKNCSKPRALERAEIIRKAVENTYFKGEENQPFGNFTISCGISSFPNNGTNLEQLIEHADKGLYLAKKYGRNRVEFK